MGFLSKDVYNVVTETSHFCLTFAGFLIQQEWRSKVSRNEHYNLNHELVKHSTIVVRRRCPVGREVGTFISTYTLFMVLKQMVLEQKVKI